VFSEQAAELVPDPYVYLPLRFQINHGGRLGMKKILFAFLVLSVFPVFGNAMTADEYYHNGLTSYQAGKWGEAISYLEGAIQENFNHWQAYQLLGYSYYRINDTQKSIQNCEASLKINPNNPALQTFVDKLKAQNIPAPAIQSGGVNAPALPALPLTNAKPEVAVNSFYFNGGVVGPYAPADFVTYWTYGPSLGLGYGIGLNRMTSLVFSAHYSHFSMDQDMFGFPPPFKVTGGSINTFTLLINGKFILVGQGDPVELYLMPGLGFSQFTSEPFTLTDTSTGESITADETALSESGVAFRFGIGIDIRLTKGVYLTLESDGISSSVPENVFTEQVMTSSMFSFGMRLDM
jgi:hypothetical protein